MSIRSYIPSPFKSAIVGPPNCSETTWRIPDLKVTSTNNIGDASEDSGEGDGSGEVEGDISGDDEGDASVEEDGAAFGVLEGDRFGELEGDEPGEADGDVFGDEDVEGSGESLREICNDGDGDTDGVALIEASPEVEKSASADGLTEIWGDTDASKGDGDCSGEGEDETDWEDIGDTVGVIVGETVRVEDGDASCAKARVRRE